MAERRETKGGGPQMGARRGASSAPHISRHVLTGLLVVLPLWVTWLVFEFIVTQLSRFGHPWAAKLSRTLRHSYPELAETLVAPWFETGLAAVLTVLGLYIIGLMTSRVVGRRLLAWLESLITRIPFVQSVYGATRKVLEAFKADPGKAQRVVLINFPSSEMKAVGFVTRTITDSASGEPLAVVYVPTSPNPTSGYMEIVPMAEVTPTDWSFDQAMAFVVTGGTSAPDSIAFTRAERAPSEPAVPR